LDDDFDKGNTGSVLSKADILKTMNGSNDLTQAHSFTRSAVLLTMGYEGTELATGSGVIARYIDGHRYLITARHNLSGRRPGSDIPISNNGGVPNQLRVEGCNLDFAANLYNGENDPNSDTPLYATHAGGSAIDVTVFRVPAETRVDYPLDQSFLMPRYNSELPLYVGQTCYVLGFPEGLIHRPFEKATFPIWKTGNIASEPLFDFDGQPKLLVDATTRRGMSGAMVVVSEKNRNRFVGIYSGRYKQAESRDIPDPNPYFTAELGWVFRSEVVSELIQKLRSHLTRAADCKRRQS
jgi:hypothetical protein